MSSTTDLTSSTLFSLQKWVCVVTGGGTGLGLMTAQVLAQNGAKVYVTGRRAEKLKAVESNEFPSGGSIVALSMDVTSKDSIRGAVDFISTREKYINLLVNNAGVSNIDYGENGFPSGDIQRTSQILFDSQSFEGWKDMYSVNVASCYFCSVAFLPLLCACSATGFEENGNILNVSSISGITKESQNGQFAYNASKAACISLTEQLAWELKRPGIEVRVNTIAPGYFPSEMTPIHASQGDKEHFRGGKWEIPFGRPGNTIDYARAVLGLVTNGYVTGSTLVIDGGWLLAHS